MEPTLKRGVHVLVDPRFYVRRRPQPGEVVVAEHPRRKGLVLIKRVAALEADGGVVLHGDNASASDDSRDFGPVASERILGKVVGTFP
jgi:nickel-type superoxide dismutase maturation protease